MNATRYLQERKLPKWTNYTFNNSSNEDSSFDLPIGIQVSKRELSISLH